MLGGLHQRRGRDQPDDLALQNRHAVARRLALDRLEHPEDRRLLEVGQVHRHLHDAAVLERDAHRLDVAEAARAHPDGGGDALGDVEPIGGQVDVVGDERHARADHGRAGTRMRLRRTEVGRPLRGRELGRQPLELAAPDVLEVAAAGRRRGLLVEEHRHAEAVGDRGAGVARQRHAVGHRRALDRHERHDVDGAESRMLAVMAPQVDLGQRRARTARCTAASSAGRSPAKVSTERWWVASDWTSSRRMPGTARTAARDGLDRRRVAALADVGDALDDGSCGEGCTTAGRRAGKCYTPRDLQA